VYWSIFFKFVTRISQVVNVADSRNVVNVTVNDIVFKVFFANCDCEKLVIGDKCDCVSLSGVVAEVHIHTVPPLHQNTGEQLARCLTAGNECEGYIMTTLLNRHRMATNDIHRSDIEHCIEGRFQKALSNVCPQAQLSHAARLLTDLALRGLLVKRADVGNGIIMHCQIMAVEALSDLQQMIDSGELSQLFSDMFSKFANAEVIVTVCSSMEMLIWLTPTPGNIHLITTYIDFCVIRNASCDTSLTHTIVGQIRLIC